MPRLLRCLFALIFFGTALTPTVFSFQVPSDSLMRKGQQQYADGRYIEAVQTFLAAGAADGKAPAQYALGLAYAGLNDFPNARKFLQLATQKDSTNVLYHFQLAQVLVKSGAPQEAEHEYELVTQMDSTYLAAFFQLGALLNGQQKDEKRQAELFSRVLTLNPTDYISWHFLSRAVAKQGMKDSALACLKRSLDINPDYFGATDEMARVKFRNKLYKAALPFYERAIILLPTAARSHFELAECYRQESRFSEAIRSYQNAIKLDTSDAIYVGQLGQTYFSNQQYDSCILAYQKAIKLDPESPIYHLNLAYVYQNLDSTQLAVQEFRAAIAASHPENIADLYEKLGGFYFNRRLYKEAIAAFDKALQYRPISKDANLYIGYAYESLHDSKSALKYLERYLFLTKDDSSGNRQRETIRRGVESMKKSTH